MVVIVVVESIELLNSVTGDTLVIDQSPLNSYVLGSVDWDTVRGTHHKFSYVGQVGSLITGTSLGTRSITIDGWLVASSEQEMTRRKIVINRFVNPQQPIVLSYKSYTIEFVPDESVKYSVTLKENNDVVCRFKIAGTCPDPLFKEDTETMVAAANTIGMFRFPLVIPREPDPPGGLVFGVRQPSLIVHIMNGGAVPVGMRIVFRAMGTVDTPEVINVITKESIKINKVLRAGDEVVVNTSAGAKKVVGIVGGEESNYFRYFDLDNSWMQLAVGDNAIRYNALSGIDDLEVYIYYRNSYLEVQECC